MRKLMSALGAAAMLAAGLVAGAAPAQAATTCTLVQPYIYNGANLIMWGVGLDGCSGDVYWEIQSGSDGTWRVAESGTTYYDDYVGTYYGDTELPCYMRVYAKFGNQEKLSRAAWNGGCVG
ncbi:hypothetical protein [Micromonospora sp. DT31]|uniref:hypothetical protein n=1 Tax=Micromonospora sp. DT31 TaxID=3393434 RepID=UPI003CFB2999